MQVWFRKLWSLSLVPHSAIISTYLEIRDSVPLYVEDDSDDEDGRGEQLNLNFRNYLHYIEKNWIGLPNNKTRADKADQKRKKPRFEWASWNHHSDLLEGNEITSNQSESYNSSSKVISSNFICSSVSSSFSGFSSSKAQYLVRVHLSHPRRISCQETPRWHCQLLPGGGKSWKKEEGGGEERSLQQALQQF